jgi:ribose 5-phosphate isomerase B
MMSIPRDLISKLYIASDHAGFKLKEEIQKGLPELPWEDLGPSNDHSVDYPDYADRLTDKIQDEKSFGILICGSGQGMVIRANRFSHIRAALCWNEDITRLSRQHNNANVLCLGSRWISTEEALKLILVFLNTEFEGGRHSARVEKLWKIPD